MFIGAEFRCQDHLGATAVQVTGWFAGRECERWASTDVHAGIIRIGTSTLMRRSEWLFGASGALAGALDLYVVGEPQSSCAWAPTMEAGLPFPRISDSERLLRNLDRRLRWRNSLRTVP